MMKRTLLPLLIISPLAMAEPQIEAPMPPAMVSIPAPEIIKPLGRLANKQFQKLGYVDETMEQRVGHQLIGQGRVDLRERKPISQ